MSTEADLQADIQAAESAAAANPADLDIAAKGAEDIDIPEFNFDDEAEADGQAAG